MINYCLGYRDSMPLRFIICYTPSTSDVSGIIRKTRRKDH